MVLQYHVVDDDDAQVRIISVRSLVTWLTRRSVSSSSLSTMAAYCQHQTQHNLDLLICHRHHDMLSMYRHREFCRAVYAKSIGKQYMLEVDAE
jgi:hypothetical protein